MTVFSWVKSVNFAVLEYFLPYAGFTSYINTSVCIVYIMCKLSFSGETWLGFASSAQSIFHALRFNYIITN